MRFYPDTAVLRKIIFRKINEKFCYLFCDCIQKGGKPYTESTDQARWVKIHVLQSLRIASIFSNKIYRHNKNV